jgi:glycine/D-amino acid oxidase-like deaminating enzyme
MSGASIAYFLTCRGVEVTVIERSGVACAASGKAGGFLALDWCDGTPLGRLARRSFALHAQLAEEIGGDWGYRRLTTYGGVAGRRPRASAYGVDWLAPSVALTQQLGSTETTAQVHPAKFTAAMMRAAEAQGAELRPGQVTGVVRRRGGASVKGVEVEGELVEGDAVVIAMGPWSILAAAWCVAAVYGLKGPNLVFETGMKIPAEAAFLEYREATGRARAQLFPRTDGTTYVCAISNESPLPSDPPTSAPIRGDRRRQEICGELSPTLASARSRNWPATARYPGRPAADRPRAGRRGRLHCHRSQRMGYSQRAGDRRGHGRADHRGRGAHSESVALRPWAISALRFGAAPPASALRNLA